MDTLSYVYWTYNVGEIKWVVIICNVTDDVSGFSLIDCYLKHVQNREILLLSDKGGYEGMN